MVHAGHLIHDTASARDIVFVISFVSTARTMSHHLIHAFCEGDQDIGEIIFMSHGFSIST
jgi:hypothetical protein